MKQRTISTIAFVLCLVTVLGPTTGLVFGSKGKGFSFKSPRVRATSKPVNSRAVPKVTGSRIGALPAQGPLAAGQSSTLMPDGNFLLIGGEGPDGPIAAAEVRNIRSKKKSSVHGKLHYARAGHSATLMPDGSVLIIGGKGVGGQAVKALELFDPSTEDFELVNSIKLEPRSYHTATLLTDGKVLIAGGLSPEGQSLNTLDLLDLQGTSVATLPNGLQTARQKHTATLLSDGNVLLWGGTGDGVLQLFDGELYDTRTKALSWAGSPANQEDGITPYIAASLPEDGAHDVQPDTRIALRFAKPLSSETVNRDTVTLTGPEGPLAAKVVPAENGMLAFMTPGKPLQPGTTYAVMWNGPTDRQNSPLPSGAMSFTTFSDEDKGDGTEVSRRIRVDDDDEDWVPGTENFDGKWRSKHRKTTEPSMPPLQAAPGVTAISGQVRTLKDRPLADVTLQIGSTSTKTDRRGRFLISPITAGRQVMTIDGRSANSNKKSYGLFRVGVQIKANETNTLPYTIWMPKLDLANAVTIKSPTPTEVVVTNPHIPGLELHLPRGTIVRGLDGQAVSRISITPIPTNQPPFPLPPGISVPTFFTIQPGGARVIPPRARLIYPNFTRSRPGTRIDFWNYDADGKDWYVYGRGTVSPDGKQIVPDPGVVLYEFSGAMVSNPSNAPDKGPPPCSKCQDGDPIDLNTGLFVHTQTDLQVANSPIPLSLSRTYRQSDTTSRPFGIGTTHSYEIFLVGDVGPYTYMDLILPDGGRVHYERISPGTGSSDAVYEHTTSASAFYKSRIEWNSLGALDSGWKLTLQDGSRLTFPDSQGATVPRRAALIGMRDRHGNEVLLTRDGNSNLTKISIANGRWIELFYDAENRITQAKDTSQRTVGYAYDANGRLWKVTDPNGGVTEYTYDSYDQMLTIKDARGIVFLTNEYDTDGRVKKQIQADSTSYQFAYTEDVDGNVTQTDVTDPRGNIRRVTFNPSGFVLTDTHAMGDPKQQTSTVEREAGTNLILSETDPLGRQTTYAYDSKGNATAITRLAGTAEAATTNITYQPSFNQVASITDPLDHSVSFNYDETGNLLKVTDSLNHQSIMTYGVGGKITSVVDSLGNTLQFGYESGDLTKLTDQAGYVTNRPLDAAGRPIAVINAQGHAERYLFDAMNRLKRITDPAGGATSFAYDPIGKVTSVTDARGNAISYVYNNMRRLESRTDQLNKTATFEYDAHGNLTRTVDRRGKVNTFSYDNLNRRTFVGIGTTVQGGTTSYDNTLTVTYDAGDRITKVVDSNAGTVDFAYDNLDRLTSETTANGTISYTYDAAGRRETMTVAGQPTVSYTYDAADRLTVIAQGTSNVSFAYDDSNRLTSLTLPNGVLVEYEYNTKSQVTAILYKKGAAVLGNLTYQYNNLGKRFKVGGTLARTNLPGAFNSATYNPANQLTLRGSTNLTYDDDGNLLNDGTNTYTWNSRNQLESISGGTTAGFQYDALGRRVSKTVGGSTTDSLYDGSNPVQELSAGTPTANMLTGGVDQVFTRTSAADTHTFLVDALGSTLALTDSAGNLQTDYTYDPFGNTSTTGTSSNNTAQYTGRENDGTGLYYYRARYYSPSLQRFISEDPIGPAGGINLYAYAANDPISFTDAYGLNPDNSGSGSDGQDIINALRDFVEGAKRNISRVLYFAQFEGAGAVAASAIWTRRVNLSAVENAYGHWMSHRSEFNFNNAKEYVEFSHEFINNPPKSSCINWRTNGDVVIYDPLSDVFGVGSQGVPRTVFKPNPAIHGYPTNLDYFFAQF